MLSMSPRFVANIILIITLIFSGLPQQSLNAKFDSLTSLSEAVFKNLPEHSSKIDNKSAYPKPIFSAQEFQELADDFINIFRDGMFNQTQLWINHEKPSAQFFIPPSLNTGYFNSYKYAHVQRKTISSTDQVCFVGDIHGSIHSVIRILWRLVQLGKIADDFTIIDPKFYMVFNGDFVDRGRYGIEVWYTLMQLKKANKDRVFLLRGNHEDTHIQSRMGFAGTRHWSGYTNLQSGELYSKFNDDAVQLKLTIDRLCSLLPHALYLGSGSNTQRYYFQCCHGGIEPGFNPSMILSSSKDFFQLIPQRGDINCYHGFNWSDFCQHGDGQIHDNETRCCGYVADVVATQKYLDSINTQLMPAHTSLVGFMRGHQDMTFGCKMLFKPEKFNSGRYTGSFKNGPYHWTDVVTLEDQKKPSFGLASYVQIYTFSTAAEGQGVPYDCFGILKMGTTFQNCSLDVYEIALDPQGNNERHNKFVSIKPTQKQDCPDLIDIGWSHYPISNPIDAMLIAKAKNRA